MHRVGQVDADAAVHMLGVVPDQVSGFAGLPGRGQGFARCRQPGVEAVAQLPQGAAQGFEGDVMPWDWSYYAEKYKNEKYALSDEQVKPYFELEKVKKGVFLLANKLYGLNFARCDDIAVYHPDVTAYEVTDA